MFAKRWSWIVSQLFDLVLSCAGLERAKLSIVEEGSSFPTHRPWPVHRVQPGTALQGRRGAADPPTPCQA